MPTSEEIERASHWEKRLTFLAGHPKTPRAISEDIIRAWQELSALRAQLAEARRERDAARSEVERLEQINKGCGAIILEWIQPNPVLKGHCLIRLPDLLSGTFLSHADAVQTFSSYVVQAGKRANVFLSSAGLPPTPDPDAPEAESDG